MRNARPIFEVSLRKQLESVGDRVSNGTTVSARLIFRYR